MSEYVKIVPNLDLLPDTPEVHAYLDRCAEQIEDKMKQLYIELLVYGVVKQ